MQKLVMKYIALVGINLLYACVTIFTKYASQQDMMSMRYLLGLGGSIGVMGAYAILWQQVLKRVDLSTAYMFKGTNLVFVMLLAAILFGEAITWMNLLGAIIIVTGITLYAKA